LVTREDPTLATMREAEAITDLGNTLLFMGVACV
jgi:hypothetical protein